MARVSACRAKPWRSPMHTKISASIFMVQLLARTPLKPVMRPDDQKLSIVSPAGKQSCIHSRMKVWRLQRHIRQAQCKPAKTVVIASFLNRRIWVFIRNCTSRLQRFALFAASSVGSHFGTSTTYIAKKIPMTVKRYFHNTPNTLHLRFMSMIIGFLTSGQVDWSMAVTMIFLGRFLNSSNNS